MAKKAFITGANKGIGFGISKHLGLSGWEIIIGARNQERAEKAISELKSLGVKVSGWVNIELGCLESVSKAAEEIKAKHPDIELVINNAGIPGDMSEASQETEIAHIKETIDINYIGTYAFIKEVFPVIEANKGRIVNITVPSEVSPYWHPLAYVASKAAQNAMTQVMAMEFSQKNIPVETYSIHPGPTTTDLNGNMALPGFHNIDNVGEKVAEVINDGQNHNGEMIELYPIVEE
ncbi:MAG: SDR family NAD(P)-dependent oxidoreductase [Bacteroidales bacterium]|nr:SDR family NAD(P)-dependent oxidoreductase [Bacteroidales bacterium]